MMGFRPAARERGFGPPELLLSLALTALVGSSTYYFVRAEDPALHESDQGRGMQVGKRKLDILRHGNYAALAAGCDTVEHRYIRRWYVSTELGRDRKTVELLVSWPLSARHTVSLHTVIGDGRYRIN